LVLAGIGFLLLSTVESNKIIFYTGGAFLGLGFSILSGSALRYIMLNEVTVSERATTQGLITIFVSIGQMTGAAIIGSLVASHSEAVKGYKSVFFFISVFAIILAVAGFFLKNRKRELQTVSDTSQ
jgi:MFS family permease